MDEAFKNQFDKQPFNDQLTASQYGVSPIPYHTHNGTDSPLIAGTGNNNLFGSTVIDFPFIPSGGAWVVDFTVTGAEEGDCCVLGIPVTAMSYDRLIFNVGVSAVDTVRIKLFNGDPTGINLPSETYNVTILKQ